MKIDPINQECIVSLEIQQNTPYGGTIHSRGIFLLDFNKYYGGKGLLECLDMIRPDGGKRANTSNLTNNIDLYIDLYID